MAQRFSAVSVPPETLQHRIPVATGIELDFGNDEKGMRRYRARLYAINKDNAAHWRFRSMRNGSLLMVWRLS
jgi:hypothetical protein